MIFEFLFSEHSVFNEIMLKNMLQTVTKHIINLYGASAYHAGLIRI